jgi:hypothetical protein
MNKLTPYISDLNLGAKGFRGIEITQQSRLTDNIQCIVDTLSVIARYDNGMPCRCDSDEISILIEQLSQYNGISCDSIRKTFFPDLEILGFVKRGGKGRNWDFIHITNYGTELISENDDFKRKLIIQNAYHRYRSENKEMFEFIKRLEEVINYFGNALWWEVWMSMRLDVNFDKLMNKMILIRKEFRIKKNTLRGINEVTRLFMEHNKEGKKQNGVIDFENIINKVTSFGIKATFFFFSVEGSGRTMIIKGQFDTSTKKAQRTYKRDPYYIIDGDDKGLEYHHIVPFENVHYNLNLHNMIDSRDNLIPITSKDHSKFPKSNNDFVKIIIVDGQVRFYSLSKKDEFIQLDNSHHLNILLIEKHMVEFNKKLIIKLF